LVISCMISLCSAVPEALYKLSSASNLLSFNSSSSSPPLLVFFLLGQKLGLRISTQDERWRSRLLSTRGSNLKRKDFYVIEGKERGEKKYESTLTNLRRRTTPRP
jgi:hypothetical protein